MANINYSKTTVIYLSDGRAHYLSHWGAKAVINISNHICAVHYFGVTV